MYLHLILNRNHVSYLSRDHDVCLARWRRDLTDKGYQLVDIDPGLDAWVQVEEAVQLDGVVHGAVA